MSEGSIPPFGLRSFSGNLFKQTLGRLFKRVRRSRPDSRKKPDVLPDPALVSRAAAIIEDHARSHATLFERAARLLEKAERLEWEGTPSESAHNRAERAKMEAEASLATLRSSFTAGEGPGGKQAFDQELQRLYHAFRIPDTSL